MLCQYQSQSFDKCNNLSQALYQNQDELSFQEMFLQFSRFDLGYLIAYSNDDIRNIFRICENLILYIQNSCLKQTYFDQLSVVITVYNKIIRQCNSILLQQVTLSQQKRKHVQQLNKLVTNLQSLQNVSNQNQKQLQESPLPFTVEKKQDIVALKNQNEKSFNFSPNDKIFASQVIQTLKCKNKAQKIQKEQLQKQQQDNLLSMPFRIDKSKLCCLQYVIQNQKFFKRNDIKNKAFSNQNIEISSNNLIFLTSEQELKTAAQRIKAIRQSICGLANSKNTSGGIIFIGFQKGVNPLKNQQKNNQIYVVKGEYMSQQTKNQYKKRILWSVKNEIISKGTQNSERFNTTNNYAISGVDVRIDFIPIVKSIYVNYKNKQNLLKDQNFMKDQIFYKPNFYITRFTVMPSIMTCKKTFIIKQVTIVQSKRQKQKIEGKQTDSQTPQNSAQTSGTNEITTYQVFLYNHLCFKNQKISSSKLYDLIKSRYANYNTKDIQKSNKNLSSVHLHFDEPKNPFQIQISIIQEQNNDKLTQQFVFDNQFQQKPQQQPQLKQNLIIFSNQHRAILQDFLNKEKINFQITNEYEEFRKSRKTEKLHIFRHNKKNQSFNLIEKALMTMRIDGKLNKDSNKKIHLLRVYDTIFVKTNGAIDLEDWKRLSGWIKIHVDKQQHLKIYRMRKTMSKQQELGYYIQTSTSKGGIFTWIFLNDKCQNWDMRFVKPTRVENYLKNCPNQNFYRVQFQQFQLQDKNQDQ